MNGLRRTKAGYTLGRLPSIPVGFHGATPSVQGTHIADAATISGGESPSEAEHNALAGKVNAILAALRTKGLIASS